MSAGICTHLPGMDGLACLDRICARDPEVKLVILSVSTDPDVIQDVLNRGASAYMVKSVNPVDLPSALRQALEGSVFNAIGLPERQVADDAAKAAGLTDRETSILKALAGGLSNDSRVPPDEHLSQARRLEPHRSDAVRLRAQARRSLVARSRLTTREGPVLRELASRRTWVMSFTNGGNEDCVA
jgi:FixJ family two-component response regulator